MISPEPVHRTGDTNPYQAPATLQPPNKSHPKVTALSSLIGGFVTAVAIYWIYVDDPRTGTAGPSLEFAVTGGTILSSAIWAISARLHCRGPLSLALTITMGLVCAGLWIAIGGTYADVLAAAACVAWPCGGLLASIAVYIWSCF